MRKLVLGLLFLSIVSCKNEGSGEKGVLSDSNLSSGSFVEGKDFTVFERVRIWDKTGFSEPVEALSILLPKNWKTEGEVIWTMPGNACEGNNLKFKAESPDGKYTFEILPIISWNWSSNPQNAQFSSQMQTEYCKFRQPISAEEFLRTDFAQEIGNPEISDVRMNQEVSEKLGKDDQKARMEMMGYGASDMQFENKAVTAKLKWPDGKLGYALCGMKNARLVFPNPYMGTYDEVHSGTAQYRMVFTYPAEDEEKALEMFTVILTSNRTNPDWKKAVDQFWVSVRQNKDRISDEKIRVMDERTKMIAQQTIEQGNRNLQNIDNQTRSWESQPSENDRSVSSFIKTIREVENYQDANGKVELSSGYDHAWSRNDNSSFIMTNNSNFDPSSVFQDQNWQEMKKVD